MRSKRPTRLSMALMFSMFVCCINLISAFIVGTIGFLIDKVFALRTLGNMAPIAMILIVLVSSTIVGTVVTALISRIPLRPVRKVIAQMKELAGGNFNAHLEIDRPPEFHELAESFNSMARELGSIEMLRADFVNNFSHEFKTPIVSIKGFAEMLKYGELTCEERDEYLDIVISESARLAELSTHVLYLSKVENQEILTDVEPIDLAEQIRRTILLLRTKWEKKRIAMEIDLMDISLCGNEEMLGQVWLNVIDNAIKFTPEGGSIRIRLTLKDSLAVFTIRDSGCGISQEALARVFDRFYQADTSHATAGNGLGLTLAYKIVALHKGTIRYESAENQGTTFTVELPTA